VYIGDGCYVPVTLFQEEFNRFCRSRGEDIKLLRKDYYAAIFEARNMQVREDSLAYPPPSKGQQGGLVCKAEYIIGVDLKRRSQQMIPMGMGQQQQLQMQQQQGQVEVDHQQAPGPQQQPASRSPPHPSAASANAPGAPVAGLRDRPRSSQNGAPEPYATRPKPPVGALSFGWT